MAEKKDVPHYHGHRERVRAKILFGGGNQLADYELLEAILMNAIPRRDVKPLAKDLIAKFKSFAGVVNAPVDDLLACDGISEVSAAAIKVILLGVTRLCWQNLKNEEEVIIQGFDAMVDYCRMTMAHLDVEEFRVVYLDAKNKVIDIEVMQRGTIDCVAIHPREVIRGALDKAAKAIIMVHNHPSGDVEPSRADIEMTKAMVNYANSTDIVLHDHIIISKNNYYSFRDTGYIVRK